MMSISKRDYKTVLERMRRTLIENCQDIDALWVNKILDDIDDCLDDVDAPHSEEDVRAMIRAGLMRGERK